MFYHTNITQIRRLYRTNPTLVPHLYNTNAPLANAISSTSNALDHFNIALFSFTPGKSKREPSISSPKGEGASLKRWRRLTRSTFLIFSIENAKIEEVTRQGICEFGMKYCERSSTRPWV